MIPLQRKTKTKHYVQQTNCTLKTLNLLRNTTHITFQYLDLTSPSLRCLDFNEFFFFFISSVHKMVTCIVLRSKSHKSKCIFIISLTEFHTMVHPHNISCSYCCMHAPYHCSVQHVLMICICISVCWLHHVIFIWQFCLVCWNWAIELSQYVYFFPSSSHCVIHSYNNYQKMFLAGILLLIWEENRTCVS